MKKFKINISRSEILLIFGTFMCFMAGVSEGNVGNYISEKIYLVASLILISLAIVIQEFRKESQKTRKLLKEIKEGV